MYVPLSPEPKGNRLSQLGCNARPSMKTLLLFDGLFVFSIIVLFIRNNLSPEIFIPWKVFIYICNPSYDGSVSVNRRLTSFLNVTKPNPARDEQSPDRQTAHSCSGEAFKGASKLDESCRGGGGERTKHKRKQNKWKYWRYLSVDWSVDLFRSKENRPPCVNDWHIRKVNTYRTLLRFLLLRNWVGLRQTYIMRRWRRAFSGRDQDYHNVTYFLPPCMFAIIPDRVTNLDWLYISFFSLFAVVAMQGSCFTASREIWSFLDSTQTDSIQKG